jgi:hypothetical protein
MEFYRNFPVIRFLPEGCLKGRICSAAIEFHETGELKNGRGFDKGVYTVV